MSNELQLTPKQKIASLLAIMQTSYENNSLVELDVPIDHYHAEGLYGRRMYAPANTLIISKVHCSQQFTIALKGKCRVLDQDGNKYDIEAPSVFVTEKGTQRAIYCYDDVEWITVHASDSTDIDEIEERIFCDSFEEFDSKMSIHELITVEH